MQQIINEFHRKSFQKHLPIKGKMVFNFLLLKDIRPFIVFDGTKIWQNICINKSIILKKEQKCLIKKFSKVNCSPPIILKFYWRKYIYKWYPRSPLHFNPWITCPFCHSHYGFIADTVIQRIDKSPRIFMFLWGHNVYYCEQKQHPV